MFFLKEWALPSLLFFYATKIYYCLYICKYLSIYLLIWKFLVYKSINNFYNKRSEDIHQFF
jgi:hypothetical protein